MLIDVLSIQNGYESLIDGAKSQKMELQKMTPSQRRVRKYFRFHLEKFNDNNKMEILLKIQLRDQERQKFCHL